VARFCVFRVHQRAARACARVMVQHSNAESFVESADVALLVALGARAFR
jgi:hypothetical protein